MGGLRRKRALLKKVTSFNLYADQWAQIQAIMEGTREQKEAPVLRELIDEALGARRRKFVRHDQEDETPTVKVEVEALETIRLLMVKLLQQATTSLRVDGVNLGLLQETLAEARAGRKCLWESLVVPSLRERGHSAEEISNLFEEDTARAKDFAYALAQEIVNRVHGKEKRSPDEIVGREVRAAG